MGGDPFLLLASCLFGPAGPGAAALVPPPAGPAAAPPPAPAPENLAPLALPPIQFGQHFAQPAVVTGGGEVPSATPSTTPAAATPVKPPQRPIELYAGASATHIQYAGASVSADWHSFTLGAVAPLRRSALTLEVTPERRSGTTDVRIMAQLDGRLGPSVTGYLALAATPQAHFRETWSLAGGLDWALTRQVGLTLDARSATYQTGRFTSLAPALRLSPRALPVEVTAKWINLWDPTGQHWSGWSLKGSWEISDRAQVFAGYASYPDPEAGVTRRMRSAYAGAALPLGRRLTLRLTASRDVRAASYTGTTLALGLSWRLAPGKP